MLENVHEIELGEEYIERRRDIRNSPDIMKKKDNSNRCLDLEYTMSELKVALQNCANTAPGCDRVSYIMVKHLPETVLMLFHKLYYKILSEWSEMCYVCR